MKHTNPGTGKARRSAEAAFWFTRVRAGGLTAKARRRLKAWLAQSENRQELIEIQRVWNVLEHVPRPEDVPRPLADERRELRPPNLAVNMAACIVVLALAGALASQLFAPNNDAFETHAGEWQEVTLEDGSIVTLGPRTSLRVELSERRRVVRVSHGEALFEVRTDSSRQFIAMTDGAVARAIGTKFAMTGGDGQPVITVSEGEVLVYRSESDEAESVPVSQGMQVTVTSVGPLVAKPVDVTTALAWTERRLELRGETIGYAVAEFNRRNALQIEIDDEAVARKTLPEISFQLDDPESFAQTLASSGLVTIVRAQPSELRLESGPSLKPVTPPG